MEIGARYSSDGICEFAVWAPRRKKASIKINAGGRGDLIPMKKDYKGYWKVVLENIRPGMRYCYRLDDGRDRPDPASHFQPEGIHGPSCVVDHSSFRWDDRGGRGTDLSDMIIYELHVGAFTPEGTFESIIPRLDDLSDLGVNTIEIMPVAQFPGQRNWGYDGVYPYAVQNTYGGPEGLKRLVNECHNKGIAIILDVVYNHLGPEGNYLGDFGPYFTDKYKTPWGRAINFDGPFSDNVRNFFIKNALFWFRNYHIDALRIDAVHSIFDMSAKPFLLELAERVDEFSRKHRSKCYLIAESDLNDSKVIRPKEMGGYGIDAQWLSDFHHALHTLLTNEDKGYYADFGKIEHLVKAIREGFVYSGQYSKYRLRLHGNSSKDCPTHRFIVFAQNHDQVGNRMLGERLTSLISFEGLKLAAGIVILSPYIPLFFMGEEYGEESPFLYFTSHSDPRLVDAVRKGRIEEFEAFRWKGEPPDPQNPETFLRSKIRWERRKDEKHRVLLEFYKYLIRLRKTVSALSRPDRQGLDVYGLEAEKLVFIRRWVIGSSVFSIFNFNKRDMRTTVSLPEGEYLKVLDSAEERWGGPESDLPKRIALGNDIMVKGLSFATFLLDVDEIDG
ncbi:MAG: malto-oligosyltrehalose trehalohydrolase [archaeon]|nr:malto-oligosyltrehalose trehalohydrolase [archaeon]MCP8306982.1 malto-oligosyltrehalose trehalohydrolase [archaeon]